MALFAKALPAPDLVTWTDDLGAARTSRRKPNRGWMPREDPTSAAEPRGKLCPLTSPFIECRKPPLADSHIAILRGMTHFHGQGVTAIVSGRPDTEAPRTRAEIQEAFENPREVTFAVNGHPF